MQEVREMTTLDPKKMARMMKLLEEAKEIADKWSQENEEEFDFPAADDATSNKVYKNLERAEAIWMSMFDKLVKQETGINWD